MWRTSTDARNDCCSRELLLCFFFFATGWGRPTAMVFFFGRRWVVPGVSHRHAGTPRYRPIKKIDGSRGDGAKKPAIRSNFLIWREATENKSLESWRSLCHMNEPVGLIIEIKRNESPGLRVLVYEDERLLFVSILLFDCVPLLRLNLCRSFSQEFIFQFWICFFVFFFFFNF